MMQIEHDFRPWIIRDGDSSAILIVKDIEAFAFAICNALESDNLLNIRTDLSTITDLVEFGVVDRREDGVVEWKDGEFVEGDEVSEIEKVMLDGIVQRIRSH